MSKQRLDLLLTRRGLAESREKAQRLILAGEVTVDGETITKPSAQVSAEAEIAIITSLPYVSRGGIKLQRALDAFGVDVRGKVVADLGASTGGFTDCLLQHGAARVYAIDVGYGQLAWALQQDPRVIVMDRTNARYLESLPEPVDLVTIDVSFISLLLVLPAAIRILQGEGEIIALIKPQFEAGRAQVGRGGVVRSPAVHREVLERVALWSQQQGLLVCGMVPSPIKGPAGNIEFLIYLCLGEGQPVADVQAAIERCLRLAEQVSDY